MHVLIDRAVEDYLRSAYGEILPGIAADGTACGLARADARLAAAARLLGKPYDEVLEDLGAWLAGIEPVRRLLRFSGRDLRDFLLSLEELPGRAELVLPALRIPPLQAASRADCVVIRLLAPDRRWQHVLAGLIRGMADDYGALCLISGADGAIRVQISEEEFAAGRQFTLQLEPPAPAAGAR